MANIVIINPRFDSSFWGMEHCIGLLGKRANLPVACLALLAALVPDHHHVTLIDENVEDIDFDQVGKADLVCLTGMSIQGRRMGEIIEEVKVRGVTVAVGGPMATVEPEQLEG
ncbi:MAG TPA: B12-binding domain-containing radical SAM protein, partial [Methyloceanibacter sp.]|nr:B12-binding domain-containing radical SAM protein [Methyloceanibacter sp.]